MGAIHPRAKEKKSERDRIWIIEYKRENKEKGENVDKKKKEKMDRMREFQPL